MVPSVRRGGDSVESDLDPRVRTLWSPGSGRRTRRSDAGVVIAVTLECSDFTPQHRVPLKKGCRKPRMLMVVEFQSRSSRKLLQSGIRESGADAQFPSETQHLVVVCSSPDANGVQGVAGSNPAVPM